MSRPSPITCAPDCDHYEYETDCDLSREGSEDEEAY